MSTSWSRSILRHLQYSRHDSKILYKLSNCWRGRCHSNLISLGLHDCWNLWFGRSVHLICFAKVVGRVPSSQLCQFVKLHLLLSKPHHAVLHCFGDCAHHPAGFIIFTQLALLWILVIFPIFHIHLIVRTCKIAQTDSESIQHLFECRFRLSGG